MHVLLASRPASHTYTHIAQEATFSIHCLLGSRPATPQKNYTHTQPGLKRKFHPMLSHMFSWPQDLLQAYRLLKSWGHLDPFRVGAIWTRFEHMLEKSWGHLDSFGASTYASDASKELGSSRPKFEYTSFVGAIRTQI